MLLVPLSEKISRFSAWFFIVSFWTIVFFAAALYDLFSSNALDRSNILVVIAAIYCATLAIYSAEKEFRRWHHLHETMHPGEIYVVVWTFLLLFLIGAEAFSFSSYNLPAEISVSYIAVISILAVTRESKSLYKKKRGEA